LPPGVGGTATGEEIVLTASDGTQFAAYAAHAGNPGGAQVVILPDVRGLHQFYKELALRFAEMGFSAVAIDYFGRTAGVSSRNDSFEYMPHVQQLQIPTVFADITAALDYLRKENPQKAAFTTGFCLGGSLSLASATNKAFGLAGSIAFYAGLSRKMAGAQESILDASKHTINPVLGLFGGADQGIPTSQVEELDKNLDAAGVEHEIKIYPGATHSFFDRRATEFAAASSDAWQKVLKFISEHSSQTIGV
ncbi:MAG TPA: dienelactone hydrolase family protein, partial [Ktedonobacteraceae bacterium]